MILMDLMDLKVLPFITLILVMPTIFSRNSLTIMSLMTTLSSVASLENQIRRMELEEALVALVDSEVLEVWVSVNRCLKMMTSSVVKWATDLQVFRAVQQVEVAECQVWQSQ